MAFIKYDRPFYHYSEPDWELSMVNDFIDTHRNHNTKSTYNSSEKPFIAFCQERNIHHSQTRPSQIAIFLIQQLLSGKTMNTIRGYRSAIRNLHKFNSFIPSDSPIVSATINVLTAMSDPATTKPEFTDFHLRSIFALVNFQDPIQVRDYTMIVFQFKGIFRQSEVALLKAKHASFEHDAESNTMFIKLTLPVDSENTTKNKHQRTVLLAADLANIHKCPIYLLNHYLLLCSRLGRIKENSQFLFQNFNTHSHLATTHINKALQAFCSRARLGHFTSHCLRVGGASAALRNGIPPHLVKRQGGWLSDAYLIYIRDTYSAQLSVSQAI